MIELADVRKDYPGNLALRVPALSLVEGQTTALIGSSGSGKSTLLRMILGLIPLDAGEIRIGGTPLKTENMSALRRRTGYVVQDSGLFPHLTVRQNVMLPGTIAKWPAARLENRVRELSALLQLDVKLLTRFPQQLSGGQRQRASLVRALFLDPDLLLLDEPLGALDPVIRYDLQAQLKEVFSVLKKTVVLVTHDFGEAAFLSHQIVLLDQGRIVQQGTPAELREHPASPFVTQFVSAHR